MNNFQTSLDKYLTTEPYDGEFETYVEQLYENVSQEVWNHMEENGFLNSDTENYWLNKLYSKLAEDDWDDEGNPIRIGYLTIEEAGAMIERSYRYHFMKNQNT